MSDRKKILVIRNDKLGDFMLAFPSFIALKNAMPNAEVHALVPKYTADMAAQCRGIDKVILDPGEKSSRREFIALVSALRREQYDAAISLFSTTRIGWALWLARIPYRLAPATKLAQIFYNHKLVQRRSQSIKPEFEYNLDLIRRFCDDHGFVFFDPSRPILQFNQTEVAMLRKKFCENSKVNENAKIVFVHPGSGGSANNLSLMQYARLAVLIAQHPGVMIVISAGPLEADAARQVEQKLLEGGIFSVVFVSQQGLISFAKHLAFADLFISGSTGPLHIAAAMNRNTVAFYPRSRVNSSLRWQTVNESQRRLAFSPPDHANEDDMGAISMEACVDAIRRTFFAEDKVVGETNVAVV